MLRIFGHFVPAATVALGVTEAFFIAAALYFGIAVLSADPVVEIAGGRLLLPMFFALGIVAMMHSGGLYNVDALVDARRFQVFEIPSGTILASWLQEAQRRCAQ